MSTYGKSLAAQHLQDLIDSGKVPRNVVRSIGKLLTGLTNQINQLQAAYKAEMLTAQVYANMLRLLREDIADAIEYPGFSYRDSRVSSLTHNIAQSYIKRAERVAKIGSFAKKSRRVAQLTQEYATSIAAPASEIDGIELLYPDPDNGERISIYRFYDFGGVLGLHEIRPDLADVDKTEALINKRKKKVSNDY